MLWVSVLCLHVIVCSTVTSLVQKQDITVCLLEASPQGTNNFLYVGYMVLDRSIIYELLDIDVGIYFVVCCLM